MNRYDVIVIGGGAAGLSAALVLSRARRKVLVVDAGSPRNAPATHMHGYLSRDGMPPAELLAAGRDEVRGYGGEIADGAVTDVVHDGQGFTGLLASGQRISARRVLVTTGLRDELPDVPGLRDRWARNVLHCPYCHGHEVSDRRLGVVGGTPGAVRYTQIVRQWTHDLTYSLPPTSSRPSSETSCSPAASASSKAPSTSWSSTTPTNCGVCSCATAASFRLMRCSCRPVSSLTAPCSSAWAATSTSTAGSPSTPQAAPAFPVSGRPGTSSTRVPRSSPPQAPAPRPPSPSTPTWSRKTSETPSTTSTTDSNLTPRPGNRRRDPPPPEMRPKGHVRGQQVVHNAFSSPFHLDTGQGVLS